jgi:hypothetical protein
MNRRFLVLVLVALSSAAICAQQPSQQGPYQGTSTPPPDDAIVADQEKPPAGQPMVAPQAAPDQAQTVQQQGAAGLNQAYPAVNAGADMTGATPPLQANPIPLTPGLTPREFVDPDGDIVHPTPLRPGELGEGTMIRVKLLDRISTAQSEKGEPFRSQVATDVLEGGQVLIPAGTEIDGTVAAVSSGHVGSSGYLRLRPEAVILADGSRYMFYAAITGTPGSNTHVAGEGTIKPDSRWKRDGIEYGGAVAGGAVTGAVLGGPWGALAGGLVGAGAVTTHLLVSHSQAVLEPGTTLLFTLTEPLQMGPPNASGN